MDKIPKLIFGRHQQSTISSALGLSNLGALRCYKLLMWLGHTARFAPIDFQINNFHFKRKNFFKISRLLESTVFPNSGMSLNGKILCRPPLSTHAQLI
jgi:hypothetical protein